MTLSTQQRTKLCRFSLATYGLLTKQTVLSGLVVIISVVAILAGQVTPAAAATACTSQCPVVPFSTAFGVARVVISKTAGTSWSVSINSSLGPVYVEQLQVIGIVIPQSLTFNSLALNGVSITPVATIGNGNYCNSGYCDVISLLPPSNWVPSTGQQGGAAMRVVDPLGNQALVAAGGSHTAQSVSFSFSIVVPLSVTVIATVVAPAKAIVSIS